MNPIKFKWLSAIAFTNIYVIWGLTFIAISFGLDGFPPFLLSGLRFFIAGLLLIGYLLIKGERPAQWINWKKNAVTGILVLTGGTGLVGWGEQYVSAAEASIAIATGPFWFIAIDKKNWRQYFSDKWIPIGLLLGFSGLLLFLGGSMHGNPRHTANSNMRIIAFAVLAISSVSWVLGSLYSKNNAADQSTLMNIAQQLIVAGIAAFLIAAFKGEWVHLSLTAIPAHSWLGLLFLIVFGSVIAYLSYIWLLSVKPAALVSTHTYINPIVTVLAGWLLTRQAINPKQFIGLMIILTGVLLTNTTKYFKLSKRKKVQVRKAIIATADLGRVYYPIHQLPANTSLH